MACTLAQIQVTDDGLNLAFPADQAGEVAQALDMFFGQQGYRLEEGQMGNGCYGRGSNTLRILFGAFVKRFKFRVAITPADQFVWATVTKAMSGAMGGVIGYSQMKKETARLKDALQVYFSNMARPAQKAVPVQTPPSV